MLEYVLSLYFIILSLFISPLLSTTRYTWINTLLFSIAYFQLLYHFGKTVSKLNNLKTDSEKVKYLTHQTSSLIFSNTSVNLLTVLVLSSIILKLLNCKVVPRSWIHTILGTQILIFLIQVPSIVEMRVLYYILEFFLFIITVQVYRSPTFVYLIFIILFPIVLIGFFFFPNLKFEDFFENFVVNAMYEGLTILSFFVFMYVNEEIFEAMNHQGLSRNFETSNIFLKGRILYFFYYQSKKRIRHYFLFLILIFMPFAQYYFIMWIYGRMPILLKLVLAYNMSIPLGYLLTLSYDKTVGEINMLTGLYKAYVACLLNRFPIFLSLALIIVSY